MENFENVIEILSEDKDALKKFLCDILVISYLSTDEQILTKLKEKLCE